MFLNTVQAFEMNLTVFSQNQLKFKNQSKMTWNALGISEPEILFKLFFHENLAIKNVAQ